MIHRLFAAVAVATALFAAPLAAQPAKTETPKATPKTEAPKAKAETKKAPVAARVNLNTASADELDKLPQIGPARAKAIMDARKKAPFKNWADFVARKVVPANAQAAIQNLVSF